MTTDRQTGPSRSRVFARNSPTYQQTLRTHHTLVGAKLSYSLRMCDLLVEETIEYRGGVNSRAVRHSSVLIGTG